LIIFTAVEGETYEDRARCDVPDPTPEPSPTPLPPNTAIIVGAVAMGGFAVVVVCAYILYQKKNSKPSSVMHRTNRSTTHEESATQPPVAVEPGNTGVCNSNTNGGILKGGTLVVSTREEEDEVIRVAFDILDRDHQRNLDMRLLNVRR
jgi:hypothetical protein